MNQSKQNEVNPARPDENHMASSNQTGHGFLTGPGLYQFPVEYAIVDGIAIHDGCIDMGPVEEVEEETARIRAAQLSRKTTEAAGSDDEPTEQDVQLGVGLPSTSQFLWTNGVVPYTVADNVPEQGRVADAIQHIEEMTAIRFVRRTAANAQRYPNYVHIISNGNAGWSSSKIGMRGGRQTLSLSDRRSHTWSILVHEFLHTLGVYHEQCRSDRDEFVDIQWQNIQENRIGNFQKKPNSVDYYAYDYGSIMHYPRSSFAKSPGLPTIVPLQSGVTIGQRNGMSYGDRQTIAKMYQRFFARGYAGVWRANTGPYALWINAEWSSFIAKWQVWNAQGLRLHDIHVRHRGNKTLYSGVFRPGTGAYALWANVSWASFKAKWQEWSNQGLRLVDFHVHRVNNKNRYSGVFLPGTGGHALWANVDWESFQNKWQQWSNQGLRLVDLHVHRVNDKTRYSGVFLPGTSGYALWANTSWSSFVTKWQEWNGQGLRLVDLNLHRVGDSIRYSGTFLPGNDGHYLWANVTYDSLRAKWQELGVEGLRLVDFEIANPEDKLAALADMDLTMDDMSAAPDELEAFGGIFSQEEVAQAADVAPAFEGEEGGGGFELGNDAAKQALAETNGEALGEAGDEAHGGSYFPNPNGDLAPEQEGLGGVFLETVSSVEAAANSEGYGGLVLPSSV